MSVVKNSANDDRGLLLRAFEHTMSLPNYSDYCDCTHHIDLDRKNNEVLNLYRMPINWHSTLHAWLWRDAVKCDLFEPRTYIISGMRRRAHSILSVLIKRGIVTFDKRTLCYDFSKVYELRRARA